MTRAHPSLRSVLFTGAAVLGLWAASFALSYAELGRAALPVALGIGLVKAVLVALFFMELVREALSVKLTAIAAAALLATLIGLVLADVATR